MRISRMSNRLEWRFESVRTNSWVTIRFRQIYWTNSSECHRLNIPCKSHWDCCFECLILFACAPGNRVDWNIGALACIRSCREGGRAIFVYAGGGDRCAKSVNSTAIIILLPMARAKDTILNCFYPNGLNGRMKWNRGRMRKITVTHLKYTISPSESCRRQPGATFGP